MTQDLEHELARAANRLVSIIIEKVKNEFLITEAPMGKKEEIIMNAKEVCDYYGFSIATLRRHEQNGLKRMNESLKNKNRMFKLTTCEKYFNQKK